MLRITVKIASVFVLIFCGLALAGEALARALPGETLLYTFVVNSNSELMVRDLTRPMTYNITRSGGTDEGGAWSPDGRRLAFISTRRGMRELFVLSLEEPRGLTVVPTGSIDVGWRPVWSPDGTRLAFELDDGRALQVAVYDLQMPEPEDENNLLYLTDAPVDSRFPAWSPDGSQLAYVTWSEGDAEIFLSTLATGETRNLTQNEGWDTTPVWSPDGRRIAFYSDRTGTRELHLLDIASGEIQQLTDFDNARFHYPSPPAWSPEGRQIALIGPIGMNGDIVIIDVDDIETSESDNQRLYTNMIFDTAPLWTPESDAVIFMSYVTGRWSLYNKPLSAPAFELTPGGNEIDTGYASWWPR